MLSAILPLDNPNEWFQVMLLRDGECRYINVPAQKKYIAAQVKFLQKKNAEGWNIHFRTSTLSERPVLRGPEGISARIGALWLDIDNKDRDIPRYIVSIKTPSFIVETGGGFHLYWALHEPLQITPANLQTVKYTLRGLAQEFGGDLAPANLSACLRLPSFINQKPNRGNVVSVIYQSDKRYTFSDFLFYTELGKPPVQYQNRVFKPASLDCAPEYVQEFLAGRVPQGQRNVTGFKAIAWLRDHKHDYASLGMLGGRACGLPEREMNSIIKSVSRRP